VERIEEGKKGKRFEGGGRRRKKNGRRGRLGGSGIAPAASADVVPSVPFAGGKGERLKGKRGGEEKR